MNRRLFIQTGLVVPVAINTRRSVQKSEFSGYVNWEIMQALRARGIDFDVFFNGEYVSNRCKEADNENGYVYLYCHDERGNAYVYPNSDVLAMELKYGKVEYREKRG